MRGPERRTGLFFTIGGGLALVAAGCTGAGARPTEGSPAKTAEPTVIAGEDASSGDAEAKPTGRDDAAAARRLAKTLKEVSQARGIVSTKEVPSKVLGRQEIITQIKEHVGRQVPEAAIRHEGETMRLLGVVPATFDYAAATFAMLETQIAGYYEPADGTMYLAADLAGDVASATLAHELVHALQDQQWDLEKRSSYQPGKSDALNAFHALAEGDATSAMTDVMVARLDKKKSALDLPEGILTQHMAEQAPGAAGVPPIMMASLVAPYVEGMRFVHALRRRGGWPAVDAAWKNPPATSEQILHPAKYDTHEAALVVEAPNATGLGPKFESVDEDTTGELGFRLLFSVWVGESGGTRLAQGWGGDRSTLATDGTATALAVRLRYDPSKGKPTRAENLVDTLGRAWKTDHLGPVAVWSPTFMCVERPGLGPLAVGAHGGDAYLFAGPADMRGPTPKSAGSCADVKRWMASVK